MGNAPTKLGYNLSPWCLVTSANFHLPSCQDSAWISPLLPYSSEQMANGEAEFSGQRLDNPKPMGQEDESSLHHALTTPPCHTHLLTIPQICRASSCPCTSYALLWRVLTLVN